LIIQKIDSKNEWETNSSTQQEYWNRVAWEKTFTHPLDLDRLSEWVSKDSAILDFGCGYGRTIIELQKAGFDSVQGVDTSLKLIDRAKTLLPTINVHHIESAKTLFESQSFDCVILFAVLTCIPNSLHQSSLITEVRRILKPDGILYLSDYMLQPEKTREGIYDEYGVFTTSEGARFRHHSDEYLQELFKDFSTLKSTSISVKTLSGNEAEAIQCFFKR
jgi:2-polyprenyl-3-methyl-5-hydroxy-6-metoxy-1,4-benzoquinol methylase